MNRLSMDFISTPALNMAKEITIYKDKPLIKNSTLERLFLSVATDEQMRMYMHLLSDGTTARATAYVSRIVGTWFDYFRDEARKTQDLEYVAYKLFKKDREVEE